MGSMIIMHEENKLEDEGNIDSIKGKLQAVSSEIDALKNSFSKSTEDLTRIQNMLSIGNLDEISGVIEKFESRVAEAEKSRMEAIDGAKKYGEELEKEKERLIKLWDAYKNQEEELSNTEKKVTNYEEQIRIVEAEKKQLEDDLTARINTLTQKIKENEGKLSQFDSYKSKCEEYENSNSSLEKEIDELKEDISTKENLINNLSKEINKLKNMEDFSEFKKKYEEVKEEYDKEKERLTKLYQLYEETDAECKILKQANKKWHNWFDSNKDIFDRLFSNVPTGLVSNPESEVQKPTEPDSRNENPPTNKTEKKKIFKLRK
jgi:chromosome segregation ATPase